MHVKIVLERKQLSHAHKKFGNSHANFGMHEHVNTSMQVSTVTGYDSTQFNSHASKLVNPVKSTSISGTFLDEMY